MSTASGPRILVPLDGSAEAETALTLASALTSTSGELHLLRVVEEWEELDDSAPGSAQAYLTPLVDRLRSEGLTVETKVSVGDPADQIIRTGDDEDVELTVMTTHGRGAVGRAFFGSVADRVVHYSARPTLLFRQDTSQVELRRIVVPLDGSSLAEASLPVAIWMAGQLSLPVHLVKIVDLEHILREIKQVQGNVQPAETSDGAYAAARVRCEAEANAYLVDHAERLRQSGVQVETKVISGTPAFALLDLLSDGDLVVMTTRGLGGFKRLWMGSVAEKLIRQARVPITVVPSVPEMTSAG